MESTVFLIGGTGFIGRFLAAELLSRGYRLITLARATRKAAAKARMVECVREIPDYSSLPLERMEVWEGDITKPLLGLSEKELRGLEGAIFLNSSANLNFKEQLRSSIEKVNILGMENLLSAFREAGGRRFFHLSTAYVCGAMRGRIPEALHPKGIRRNNAYESSKARGEELAMSGPVSKDCHILRPSIVIGSSATGYASNFTGYYHTYRAVSQIRSYLAKLYPGQPIPELKLRLLGNPRLKVDVVTVDYVARCAANIIEEAEKAPIPHFFHLCYPNGNPLQFYLDSIQEHLGLQGLRFCDDLQDKNFIELEAKDNLTFNNMYTSAEIHFEDRNNRAIQEKYGLGYPEITPEAMRRVNDCYAEDLAEQRIRRGAENFWKQPWRAVQRLLYEAHLRHQLEAGLAE